MNECLTSIKKAYDSLTVEERERLIIQLEINMKDLFFRVEEKKELISYLKGLK